MGIRNRIGIRRGKFAARAGVLFAGATQLATPALAAVPLIGDLQPITICLTAGSPDPCVPFVDAAGGGWGIMSYARGVRPAVLEPGEQLEFTGVFCTACVLPFCGSFDGFIFDATYQFCPPPPPTPDLNGDGHVDGLDLALLLGQWGRCPVCIIGPCPCAADFDGSGMVNGLDLAILLAAWG